LWLENWIYSKLDRTPLLTREKKGTMANMQYNCVGCHLEGYTERKEEQCKLSNEGLPKMR